MFGNVLGIGRWFASGPDIRIAQKLEALKRALSRRLGKRSQIQSFGNPILRGAVFHMVHTLLPFRSRASSELVSNLGTSQWNLVDRKAYAPALESKSFSKKSLSLIGSPHAKTTDDSS
jgi:hypothetical protein